MCAWGEDVCVNMYLHVCMQCSICVCVCVCVCVCMCLCLCMHVIIMTVHIILLCTSIYGIIVDPMTFYFLFL